MKGDFSRSTFRSDKHFSGVRMQQGRVQLDADWNEQLDIQAHRSKTASADVIGLSGAPNDSPGFKITPEGDNIEIGQGRYYVDGILCENEQDVYFAEQPDLPGATLPTENGTYLAYLDVWQRHITMLEDPSLREVALGGSDTATRTKTVWQVRLLKVDAPDLTGEDLQDAQSLAGLISPETAVGYAGGHLQARSEPGEQGNQLYAVSAGGGYHGLENRLYRVEIHQGRIRGRSNDLGATPDCTFKWSRDNGSVVRKWKEQNGNILTLEGLRQDQTADFVGVGQWVELIDDDRELRGEPGVFVQVKDVGERTITIDPDTAETTIDIADFHRNPKIRRWDFTQPLEAMAVCVPEENEGWIELEEGVEIKFEAGKEYYTGDYWLIPARAVLADVEWPEDEGGNPESLPPHGIKHHYCCLGLIARTNGTFSEFKDWRRVFPALTGLHLRYISGDGQEARPGQVLPQPLTVGVLVGERPIQGASVRFAITQPTAGDGPLGVLEAVDTTGTSLELTTDSDGLAACTWELPASYRDDSGSPLTQLQVEATLLDDSSQLLDVPVIFSAAFSLAQRVHYEDDDTITLPAGQDIGYPTGGTTQVALDQLRANTALYIVGGDGQEAKPGVELPQPLEVIVTNGKWRHEGARVRFTIEDGGELEWRSDDSGSLDDTSSSPPTSLDILTDADGMASCHWKLPAIDGGVPPYKQRVAVELLDDSDPPVSFAKPVHFNASISRAENVAYDAPAGDVLAGKTTVQEALDTLNAEKANRHSGDTIEGCVDVVPQSPDGSPDPLLTVQGGVIIGNVPPGTGNKPDLVVEGDVAISGDLTLSGKPTEVETAQLVVEDNVVTVNRFEGATWPTTIRYAGLEVYRGQSADDVEEPKARLLWDETDQRWKIELPEKNPVEIATIDRLPSGVARVIKQAGHGFKPGDAICYRAADGGYIKAMSDSEETTGMFLVSRIGVNEEGDSDLDCFTLVQAGYIDGLGDLRIDNIGNGKRRRKKGLDPGEFYYVGHNTPGLLTSVEPLRISNPIFYAVSPDSGYVLPYRPGESIQHVLHTLRVLEADPQAPGGALFVDQTGDLGIGTTSPGAKLTVDDPTGNTTWNTAAFRKPALGPHWSHIHWGPTGDWYIRSAANNGRVILQDTGGNVGIGTTEPEAALHVIGDLLGAAKDEAGNALRICCGQTEEKKTDWQQYGESGLYVNVDTTSGGFQSTPLYIANMHGNSNNWSTTGGSSAYHRTPTGFRVYVRFSDGRALTPAYANENGWHIQWMAIGK